MDPNATLRLILEALDNGETPEAAQSARDLMDWIDKDGFPPNFDNLSDQHKKHLAMCFAFGVVAGDLTASRA